MMRRILSIIVCAVAVTTLTTIVVARTAAVEQVLLQPGGDPPTTITLNPVGSDLNAAGSATTDILSGEQSFDVQVGKLATATYTLFVDGNNITTFTTGKGGGGQVRFDTNPHGQVQLLPSVLNPVSNIKIVEIKDSNGAVILTGSFY